AYSLHLFVALAVSKATVDYFQGSAGHSLTTGVQLLSVMAVWGVLSVEPRLRELTGSVYERFGPPATAAAAHSLEQSLSYISSGAWRLGHPLGVGSYKTRGTP